LELATRANLFVSLVQSEVGYSGYGRRVVRQGQQFASVAEQYRQVVASGTSTRQQIQIATDNLDRSLHSLEVEFHRVSGASPHSQNVLQQLSQLVDAARRSPIALPEQPIAPPSTSPGYAEVIVARDAVRQFAYNLQSQQYRGPDYTDLYRDVQALLVQLESVELLMRGGESRYEIRRAMRNVVTQANRITSDVSRVDLSIQHAWWSLLVQLKQAAQAIGTRGANQVQPSHPVIVDRPAWSQLPFQPVPKPSSSRSRETIRLADQLIDKLDGYIAFLQSASFGNANASRLVGSLQDLKHSALILRQVAASGAFGNTLARSGDLLMTQYKRTASDFAKFVARDATLNSPLFYQIGELTQKVVNAVRGRS
jgi:hypothetical protein